MSSDDDEGGSFRGGLGSGLGFGGRRKRRGGDESLLGVFADGSDDEGPKRGGGKGRGKGKGKKAFSVAASMNQPVSFVAGEKINKTDLPAKRPVAEDANSDDEEMDPRFILTAKTPTEPVEQGPKLPAKNKMSFGQMATSYGKGFAMMQKMGFTGGGLGKHNDGIANPIEVQVRKGKQGLQDEGEMVDQDLYGTERAPNRRSVDELLTSKPKKAEPKAEGWKKEERAKRPRTVYKTAAEVAAEAGDKPAMRIIDMRGPETKVATSFSELQAALSTETVKSLKELRHNTRLLVAKYEDKIRALAETKRHYEDVLLASSKELEQTKAAKSMSPEDVKQCRSLVKRIEDLRSLQDQGSISLRELSEAFSDFRSDKPKAFGMLRLFDVAVSLAVPVAKRELTTWKPLKSPKEGISALASWKGVLDDNDTTALMTLCDEVLMPKLRASLIDWSVRDFEPCIKLFECCRSSLPVDTTEDLGAHVVLPRLQLEVDGWDPRTDKMPIHLWIHPWLPILGKKLNSLWTPIRYKLSACLEYWDPRDHSACGMLKPWKLVFDPADWDPLVEKVLYKIEKSIAITPVKPSGQDLQPIQDLLAWLDIIPAVLIARVLETALFPQWHAALRAWLRVPGVNFQEVLQWYSGWRTLFPESMREQGSVQKQLAHGLEVMKSVMSGGSVPEEASSAPSEGEPPRQSSPSPTRSMPSRARPASSVEEEDVDISLSDYMGEVAAEHGLVFRPKQRSTSLGKQVYQFGAASVYFDKNLVYALAKGSADDWIPVSFDEVLKLGKRKTDK